MTAPVFAAGHWRRRDPLEGLTPAMRFALIDLDRYGALNLQDGLYRSALYDIATIAPATMTALAVRGLAEQRFARTARAKPSYRLTRRGREILAEILRRAAVRDRLETRRS